MKSYQLNSKYQKTDDINVIAPWILQFHVTVLSGVLWEGQDNRGLLLTHIVVIPIQLRVKLMPPLTVAQGIVYMKTYITFNNHSGSQSVYKDSLIYYNISLTNL